MTTEREAERATFNGLFDRAKATGEFWEEMAARVHTKRCTCPRSGPQKPCPLWTSIEKIVSEAYAAASARVGELEKALVLCREALMEEANNQGLNSVQEALAEIDILLEAK